jgi:hypothetical protein
MENLQFRPDSASTSFRDPGGRLRLIDGRILRVVNRTGLGEKVAFDKLFDTPAGSIVLEHEFLMRKKTERSA